MPLEIKIVAANREKVKIIGHKNSEQGNPFKPDFLGNDDFFFKALLKTQMKKRKMKISKTIPFKNRKIVQVISATCTCLAGGTPAFCKHVFALLHAINDYITKKLYEAPTERLDLAPAETSKMVPQTAKEVFMREPALEVENEIGFDFPPNRCYPCF
ncbi:hypothetical protein TNIN_496061 [Trichonephila inaurata madagascariensis]|uniref:SWIM-type domain-containing protein n=1 Tax=Trichonephila inaurata madagascariensis TaxID=2747483 RepID=A0A8X6YNY3_9ARAC|nr:hypothetical protein TNIN_496061 [Trichonephila inaurata madagascariensis]